MRFVAAPIQIACPTEVNRMTIEALNHFDLFGLKVSKLTANNIGAEKVKSNINRPFPKGLVNIALKKVTMIQKNLAPSFSPNTFES